MIFAPTTGRNLHQISPETRLPQFGHLMRHICGHVVSLITVLSLGTGCGESKPKRVVSEPRITGETIEFPANSVQIKSLTVELVAAEQASFVRLTGRLVWDEDATVRVFTPFAGIVRQLLVNLNEPVACGMPLAIIQSADFAQAQADARKAASDFHLAERGLDRARTLADHGAAPRKELEAAEADFAGASAEKERTERRLAIYASKLTLSETNNDLLLPSPLSGVVVERNLSQGQEVRPDQMLANMPQYTAPLFVVTDPRHLWVWLDVSEVDLSLVHPGQELMIHTSAFPDRSFAGRLELISDSLDPTTRTVRARGSVDNAEGLLKAELYVTVEVPDAVPRIQVPAKAVLLRENQSCVFVETGPGRFERKAVRLGRKLAGKVAVLEGLNPGQKLVTEGGLLLESLLDEAPKT